jgi:hypothetical protein
MSVARLLITVVFLLVGSACAVSENEEDQEAGSAVKEVLEREYVGEYGTVWDTLHPRHQRLVSREQYEECRQEIDVTGTIESVLILDIRDKPLTIYGLPPGTPSKEVEVRVTTDESEYTATYHAVRVGDSWRWVLTDRAARGFRRTDCPA